MLVIRKILMIGFDGGLGNGGNAEENVFTGCSRQ